MFGLARVRVRVTVRVRVRFGLGLTSERISGRSACVCVCRGQLRVGATANALDGAHCARKLVARAPMLPSGGYIGQRMSVHGAPGQGSGWGWGEGEGGGEGY